MGLICFTLAPVWYGITAVFLPTLQFVKHPTKWMDTVSRYNGTISFAPNFAYALAARRTKPEKVAQLDLSRLKKLGCGAEPNHPGTLQSFLDHFAPAGLAPEAILPCYGMAEATLAISFCDLDQRLIDSPVEFTSPHVVSAVTGEGIESLRDAIREVGRAISRAAQDDAFRMPVDRAFSVPGVGTVVTGTIWSGRLAVGDSILVVPAGHSARVRSLEHHGEDVRLTRHRARAAIGPAETLFGPLDRIPATVRRGESTRIDVVVRTRGVGHFFPSGTVDAFDCWLELKAEDENGRVVFWSGMADEQSPVEPGAPSSREINRMVETACGL